MKIAIIGATGLVGTVILKVLEEKGFCNHEIIAAASEKSVGKELMIGNKKIIVKSIPEAVALKPDVAIFSAGSTVSKQWAPVFEKNNCWVIDNSSAWRMDENIPLVVPEINLHHINGKSKIIANPNCSTIQMVVALAPLHKAYKIKRLVVSTYQSVTGTGVKAVEQLMNERANINSTKIYPHPIDMNVLPHGGDFMSDGYTTEEAKLVNETQKILGDASISITATVVRVPVLGGHSEAVNIEFYNEFDLSELIELLKNSEGIVIQDNPAKNEYPMPLFAKDKNEVFVGRIRRDFSQAKTLNMWIVSDNLRKGAATNAVQILESLCVLNKLN